MTPEQIKEQRAKGWVDFHPEDYCHRCGRSNIKPWYVDSALWNQAAEVHEILCPQCFVKAYETATGEAPIWRLAPSEQSDEKAALIKSEAAMRHDRDRLRVAVQDLADHGLRADLTPTIDGSTDVYAQMTRYLRRLDAAVRERARRALAPVADPDPHTTSDEETTT